MELELENTLYSILHIFRNVSRRVSNYAVKPDKGNELINSTNQPDSHPVSGDRLNYACEHLFVDESSDVILMAKICLYICVILLPIGVIGNSVNIVVVYRYLRKHSSSVYILVLAVSDSMFLILSFLGPFMRTLKCFHFRDTKLDFVNFNDIACKLVYFVGNVFNDYSSLLILCFTIERCVAVYKPMKVHKIFTIRRTKMLCLLLLLFTMTLLAPYYLLTTGVKTNIPICTIIRWERESAYLYLIETMTFRVVPVIAIAALNICIICKVLGKEPIEQHRGTSSKDQNRQMTVLLILISTSYVVLYLPLLLNHILWTLWVNQIGSLSGKALHIVDGCAQTLNVAGFSINCYLYIIGSQMFRDNVRRTFSSLRESINSLRKSNRTLEPLRTDV